jgi:hypothetical protein
MFPAVARIALVLVVCLSIGPHWAALQPVAWATMIIEYSQSAPLAKAVADTFDGKHPCDLCKHINHAQHSEKKREAQSTTVKQDLLCVKRAVVLFRSYTDLSFPLEHLTATVETRSPPVPPPRSALG